MKRLSICDYCKLQKITRETKAAGKEITIIEKSKWSKGIYVYIHPKWINSKKLDTDFGLAERYFAIWFAKMPTHCCCQET